MDRGLPFSAPENTRAIKRLKSRKAPGCDGLSAEHVKEVMMWLMRILNAVVRLEVIPDILKCGVKLPKDPTFNHICVTSRAATLPDHPSTSSSALTHLSESAVRIRADGES